MATRLTTSNLRVECNARGIEMATATFNVVTYHGAIQFDLSVLNDGTKERVIEGLRARLLLLFQSLAQDLAQGPLVIHET